MTLQRTIDQLRAEKTVSQIDNELPLKINDDDDNENSNVTENQSTFRAVVDNDDEDRLSDSDSDVIEMKQTLKQLKHLNSSIEFSKVNSQHPFRRTISYERPMSNTMLSTINKTYPLSTHGQLSSTNKTNFWQSQPSLITREAVLKAARDVLPPGVIDHLTTKH